MPDEKAKKFIVSFRASMRNGPMRNVKTTVTASSFWAAYHQASCGMGTPEGCTKFKLLNVVEVR